MKFARALSRLEDDYTDRFRRIVDGHESLRDIRVLSEHLADMAAALGNSSLVAEELLAAPIELAVTAEAGAGSAPDSQPLQDAALYLRHVRELLEAAESLAARASTLVAEFKG